MRIVFVSAYGLPHLGGIEVAVDSLSRDLARRGHDVTHVTSMAVRDDDPPAGGGARPYRTVRVAAWNGLEKRAHVPWPLFSPRLVPVLRRELQQADIVHAHGFLYLGTHVAFHIANRREKPKQVLTEHVGHVHYDSRALDRIQAGAVKTFGRAAAQAADALVVLSRKVERELAAMVPGRPIEFIPNGVDAEAYRPASDGEREMLRAELGWDDGRPRLLFAGRLVGKKGIDVALDAAARLGDRAELVVVGPGRLDHAPPPNARVLGAQPRERLAQLMRAADAFVLPSRGEGFPITAQEAMASGLPVVLGDDPSYAEYAGDGLILAAPRADAVAAALEPLVDDPAKRAAASKGALELAGRFSWERAAADHEALYSRLLGDK